MAGTPHEPMPPRAYILMVTISLLYFLSENQAIDTRGPPLPTYQSLDVHFISSSPVDLPHACMV